MKQCCRFSVCETTVIAASAFGVGVILSFFVPCGVLFGICGAAFFAAGITCVLK